MLLSEMSGLDFVDVGQRPDALSQSSHDVNHQIPILMPKVNRHFFLSILCIFWFNLLIHKIKLHLHLLELCRRIPSLPLLETSVSLTKIHEFICTI